VRKSKPRKNPPHGECVVPKGWDIETVPRLDRIAAASMSRVRHGSRSASIFDEPGGWACGQAREALDKLHHRSADPDAVGKHHDHENDRPSTATEAFW
jgi:hypothetical protein